MRGLKALFRQVKAGQVAHAYVAIEEKINSLTHLIGAGLGVAALVVLTVKADEYGTARNIVGCVIFGVCLIITYLASSLYHFVAHPSIKRGFRMLDHISIYLMIAGTYTPFVLGPLYGPWGWSLFGVVWGVTLVGTVFKIFYTGKLEWLSVLSYIALGWVALVALDPLIQALNPQALWWLLAGGLCYTLGVIFYLMETVPFTHTIWHLFVLAGSFCHFIAILFFVAKA